MTRRPWIVPLLVIVALLVVSCGSTPTTTTTSATTTATTTATTAATTTTTTAATKPAGTVTIAYPAQIPPAGLDPALGPTSQYALHYMAIYDAMFKPQPEKGGINPSLVTSYTVSSDGLVYDLKIRQGVKFHNGDPLTAEDVKFSFDRYKDASAGAAALKQHVKDVSVVDPYTVRFTLNDPWNDFLTVYGTQLSWAGWIVPKDYWTSLGGTDEARDAAFLQKPIGSGPYKFVSLESGVALTLEANEDYWAKMPSVKTIVVRVMPDESSRFAGVQTGSVDIAYRMVGVTAEAAIADPNLTVLASSSEIPYIIDFLDQWDPASPWADIRVRQAVSLAIDREAIHQAFNAGRGPEIGGAGWGTDLEFAVSYPTPEYNVERAKALLQEAGYSPGALKVTFTTRNTNQGQAEAVTGYLRAAGFDVSLVIQEVAPHSSAYQNKQLNGLIMWPTTATGNVAGALAKEFVPGGQFSYQPEGAIPEIDALWAQQAVEIDAGKRAEMLKRIQDIYHDQYRYTKVMNLASLVAVGPRIANPEEIYQIPGWFFVQPYEDIKLK